VSSQRLKSVFGTSLTSAIAQIRDAVAYAKAQSPNLLVRFTPEDTVRSPFQNVVDAASAAVEAGADIISVADTTGYMIPGTERSMYDFVRRLIDHLDRQNVHPTIAVHCHNDCGLALANALDGYRGGASIIDVSVLGLGERAGIVDLATLLASLTQMFGEAAKWNLKELMPLYRTVSRFAGIPIPVHFPIAGANAFKHCAGVHTHAAQINPLHYQSVDPEPFGRTMEISLDHMSGMASIRYALDAIGETDADDALASAVLHDVKRIGQTGRTVDPDELAMIVRWVRHPKPEQIEEKPACVH